MNSIGLMIERAAEIADQFGVGTAIEEEPDTSSTLKRRSQDDSIREWVHFDANPHVWFWQAL